ncbi:PREDICTED: agamous-like MADS-box protein AGL61 [Ipomoea nil]|uniref:agamous-like MADS-box protein AGL61 n=1 Tax=Ipomoea nil TaxID=35883 RepID=UPI000900AC75|nr:PREDICTED: agamous-like MADS-box protein AGL61 [Ipomoea nil]
MVRTKVEIKRIEDKAKRHTTFTKRRQGLFKKASELCKRCNAEAAVITFSLAGNAFAFGHPSVNAVLARHNSYDANGQPCNDRGSVDDDDAESDAQKVPEDGGVVVVASNEDLNDEDDDMKVEEMSMEELEKLDSAMEEMKRKVIAQMKLLV